MIRIRTSLIVLMSAIMLPSSARAQAKVEPPTSMLRPPGAQPPRPEPPPILIRPAVEPVPALKYRLIPDRSSLVAGNAAISYHRALLMASQARASIAAQQKDDSQAVEGLPDANEAYRWMTIPIAEIPRDRAERYLSRFRSVFAEIEVGASRRDCDWDFENRSEGYTLLIPEIQEMRFLARLLQIQARVDILDCQLDRAAKRIETAMTVARHVGEGPIFIQALVGMAIESETLRTLQELIQRPGVPSLFWALADRPHPLIDMRAAFDAERRVLEKTLPGLLDLDRGTWGLDQTRRFVEDVRTNYCPLMGGDRLPGELIPFSANSSTATAQVGFAAICDKVYPAARDALIAEGRSRAVVEAMPVVQVAMLHSYREHQRRVDDVYKWINTPYWESYRHIDGRSGLQTLEEKRANPLLAMLQMTNPAISSVRIAGVRLERNLAAWQCVEAIRLGAGCNGGKLPPSLDSIADHPIPPDPATGKPFGYQVDGDTAILSAPIIPGGPEHPTSYIRFVLKLAR